MYTDYMYIRACVLKPECNYCSSNKCYLQRKNWRKEKYKKNVITFLTWSRCFHSSAHSRSVSLWSITSSCLVPACIPFRWNQTRHRIHQLDEEDRYPLPSLPYSTVPVDSEYLLLIVSPPPPPSCPFSIAASPILRAGWNESASGPINIHHETLFLEQSHYYGFINILSWGPLCSLGQQDGRRVALPTRFYEHALAHWSCHCVMMGIIKIQLLLLRGEPRGPEKWCKNDATAESIYFCRWNPQDVPLRTSA